MIRLTSPSNFRPIHSIRPVLWRSDHLGALNAGDARQIQSLGITRVLDFRGVRERASAACQLPGVAVHSLAIEPTIVQTLQELVASGQKPTADEVVLHMMDTYRGFVRHNTHRFAEFFEHLLASDEPTVFHCTAGKDRTGFAAALLLRAVDVPEEAVLQDYLLTNERLAMPQSWRSGLPAEAMEVLWRVQPAFLEAAFEEVDRRFGSLEGYFREGLGLRAQERERLKRFYLATS